MTTVDRSSLSAVKLALAAAQAREQRDEVAALAAEPIAIIGIGCRFPGGADTPEAYWEIIRDGIDAITEVPPDRWDADQFYGADPYEPGKMNTRWGGFVDDIDRFDAGFFGISPREAAHMDPQQRMVMEVAVEALERAGQPLDSLAGTATGVFVASSFLDYGEREHGGAADIDAYSMTGNLHFIIPNRLSFTFDLQGPSVSIDTACSSSLIAIHLACQSLRSGDSNLAIAGGVNALLSPTPTVGLAKWGLMAPDGRCKTFDASANGFVRSEGCGLVVLKRLADAIADNDPVMAVIRGSAINQDGRSSAMTAPNGLAQEDMLRRALSTSHVRPDQVGMFELHGTGTVLGDPIEVEAIANVLGAPEPGAPPLALTAVKTNIGHLEAAAGVAGLIKVVLCMQHEAVPSPVHFRQLNPHISLDGTRLFVPDRLHPWPAGGTRRIAGVSSFGFGGSNAHVIVEEAPVLPAPALASGLPLLVLSAQTPAALSDAARALADHLDLSPDVPLDDVCSTAALRRTHHDERLAVLAETTPVAIERLRAFAAGERNPAMVTQRRQPGARHRVAFVCTGQGNQWWGMARDLLDESPVFRSTIERCDELLAGHVDWSLLGELTGPEQSSRLERTEVAQPALFAIQVALAALWRSWGVEPDAVVGHSIGEVAASHIAGALSLEDAVRVVAARGASMADAFGTGAMASVELPASEVATVVAEFEDRLSIAAVNGPSITVISGDADAVAEATASFTAAGATVQSLPVTYPFHSARMRAHGAMVAAALDGLGSQQPTIRMISTVTGNDVAVGDLDAAYWQANVVSPVRFADAVAELSRSGCDVFVELGAHPVLGGAIKSTISESGTTPVIAASLRRGRPGLATMSMAVGELHCAGVAVDWRAIWPGRRRTVALPTYSWQRSSHWSPTWQPAGGGSARHHAIAAGDNPLLGARLRSPAIDGFVFETQITATSPQVIDHHRIGGTSLMPATGLIEVALAGFATAFATQGVVHDLEIVDALALDPDAPPTRLQIHIRGDAAEATFSIAASIDSDDWIEHARGRLAAIAAPDATPAALDIDAIRSRCDRQVTGAELYAEAEFRRVEFGESFRGVTDVWLGDGEALARIVVPPAIADPGRPYGFHPAVLDAGIHPSMLLLAHDRATYLPVAAAHVERRRPPANEMWSYVRVTSGAGEALATIDVSLVDAAGAPIAIIRELRMARASDDALDRLRHQRGDVAGAETIVFGVDWRPAACPGTGTLGARWAVIPDRGGVAACFAKQLTGAGVPVTLVDAGDADGMAAMVADGITDVAVLSGLDAAALAESVDLSGDQRRLLGPALGAVQAIAGAGARLWLVTCGAQAVAGAAARPEQSTLLGLGAGIVAELPALRCTRIDLDPAQDSDAHASTLVASIAAGDDEDVMAWRNGERFVPRVVPIDAARPPTAAGRRLASSSYGLLDGLHEVDFHRRAPGAGEVEIEVEVSGLNFRDVLVALDLYPGRVDVFGEECSGVIVAVGAGVDRVAIGDRVLAVGTGSLASHLTTSADLVYPLPDGMDPADAATIPIAFLTAEYALHTLGRLAPGERILIHAGAGGVGMAAIQLAQQTGAIVLATAGSDRKRAVLREMGVEHVFDSRSLDFAHGVSTATDGIGVDMVLNSLAGDFIQRSVDVLAPGGRFLEIGRRDVWSHAQMGDERPDVEYHIVYLGDITANDPAAIRVLNERLMPRFASGELTPLPRTTFVAADTVEAFRFMAQARHIGKIVVRRRPVDLSPDATYLITGGVGGVGVAIAQHLVEGGARHLVLASRTPPAELPPTVEAMRADGVDVRVVGLDVGDFGQVRQLLDEVDATMPPLRGIVHAAGVIADATVGDLTWQHFEQVLRAKLDGTWNLHTLTVDRQLDMFVLMSAASPSFGALGQTNYVAANSFLDAFAGWRRTSGLPALSVGWGVWDRVGMTERVADTDRQRLARRGLLPIGAGDALAGFDTAIGSGRAHVLVCAIDAAALDRRPMFGELRADATNGPAPEAAKLDEWVALVPAMRRVAVTAFVEDHARKILGLTAGTPIAARQPLNEIGLDSLMAVELRNVIGIGLGQPQPVTLLFDHPTSAALVEHLLTIVEAAAQPDGLAADGDGMPATPTSAADIELMAGLTEAEAEALLLAELGSSEADA